MTIENNILQCQSIHKTFWVPQAFNIGKPRRVMALDGVSFALRQGEVLALLGESGSGKSTLAKIILGFTAPDSGAVLLNGQPIKSQCAADLKRMRQNVGIVFQDPLSSLDPMWSVRDILDEAMREIKPCDTMAVMEEMLKAVGLSGDMLQRYPHQMSGGERQRLAIARALLAKPCILILDEAISALDVLIQGQIIQLLKTLQERFDLTYLFITHNVRSLPGFAHRAIVLKEGKVIESSSVESILKAPKESYTRALIKSALTYTLEDE